MDYSLGYMPHIEGNWTADTQYTPMSIVKTAWGTSYIAKVAVPANMQPGQTAGWGNYWQEFAEGIQGYPGTNGAQGAAGTNGTNGTDGAQGATGAQGAAGHSPANTEVWTFEDENGQTFTRTVYMVPQP